jgi:carboxylesterase
MSVIFNLYSKKSAPQKSAIEQQVCLEGSNGSAVILIHGLTGSPQELKYVARFLNQGGYSVICPRLANHGEPIEVLKKTKWQEFYQSVRAAFQEMTGRYENIYVSGLSMGAILALLLADEFNDQVSAVSCLSPTLFYDGWNIPWYQCFLPLAYFTPLKNFFYLKEEPPYGIKNKKMQQLIHKYYSSADLHNAKDVAHYGYPYFPMTLIYQLHLMVKYLSGRLSNIKVPVQLIQSAQDDMTSVKNSQFIYDRIQSDRKELVLLNDSYHVITMDQERQKVAQNMDSFFKQDNSGLTG